jgi:hypothetical protein
MQRQRQRAKNKFRTLRRTHPRSATPSDRAVSSPARSGLRRNHPLRLALAGGAKFVFCALTEPPPQPRPALPPNSIRNRRNTARIPLGHGMCGIPAVFLWYSCCIPLVFLCYQGAGTTDWYQQLWYQEWYQRGTNVVPDWAERCELVRVLPAPPLRRGLQLGSSAARRAPAAVVGCTQSTPGVVGKTLRFPFRIYRVSYHFSFFHRPHTDGRLTQVGSGAAPRGRRHVRRAAGILLGAVGCLAYSCGIPQSLVPGLLVPMNLVAQQAVWYQNCSGGQCAAARGSVGCMGDARIVGAERTRARRPREAWSFAGTKARRCTR